MTETEISIALRRLLFYTTNVKLAFVLKAAGSLRNHALDRRRAVYFRFLFPKLFPNFVVALIMALPHDVISPLSPLTVPVLAEGRTTFSTAPSRSHTPKFPKRSESPTLSESEFEFTNSKTSIRRAMTSFENLVALANYQENLKHVLTNRKQTLREARKMVWRDRGEPVAELADIEECLKWALKGGFRRVFLYSTIASTCLHLT